MLVIIIFSINNNPRFSNTYVINDFKTNKNTLNDVWMYDLSHFIICYLKQI